MTLLSRYEAIVASGAITPDHRQIQIVEKLQALCNIVSKTTDPKPSIRLWQRVFRQNSEGDERRGMYLYGGVGSGKTMLMDLFFSYCQALDPVKKVADSLVKEFRLLCLDEFQVVDVADAMLLRNLLGNLLDGGVYFLFTSNRPPRELYLNGIQRSSFLPCIDLLERKLEVTSLIGERDYRRKEGNAMMEGVFCHPINEETEAYLNEISFALTTGHSLEERTIYTHGRPIPVRRAYGDIAVFTFDELCGHPMSAADYLCIASHFSIIIIKGVTMMTFNHRDEARRFITMIDIFYDNKIKLMMQTEVPTAELFQFGGAKQHLSLRELADNLSMTDEKLVIMIPSPDINDLKAKTSLVSGEEEAFATHRAISRLAEMQHISWWPATLHTILRNG